MKRYGLIGKSLAYSQSMGFFSRFFTEKGIDATYENFELPNIEALPELLAKRPDLQGLNVTIPFKEQVIPYLDEIDPEAAEIGAVNTLTISGGKLKGYNTDLYGFRESLKPFLAHGMGKALILGTGGASRAVSYALRTLGIEVFFVSRTPSGDRVLTYSELGTGHIEAFKLIVNTTPLGTFPETEQKPELPYHLLGADHLLYDLVYNPAVTAFMQAGMDQGATSVNGLNMLHLQAVRSYAIWSGYLTAVPPIC